MKNSHNIKYTLPLLKFYVLRTLPMWSLIALVIFLMQIAVCGIVHDNNKLTAMLRLLDMVPFIKRLIDFFPSFYTFIK